MLAAWSLPATTWAAPPPAGVEPATGAGVGQVIEAASPGADALDASVPRPREASREQRWVLHAIIVLGLIVLLIAVYTVRHYHFTVNRLFGTQRHPYVDIDTAHWPTVTVFIAAHNEEAVIADSLKALLEVDYPFDKLTLMPVNDRSSDRTREIIDSIVARHPGRIRPFHRSSGKPGKAAALKDATALVSSDIIIVFDADYLPSRGLIKQLVAPFFDPEVGATMGRVVPQNVGTNLLTRMLDLERAGGYQVDQQARMNLGLVPQYGGTVGGIRIKALESIGGWHDDVLAEDTDLTYRLLLKNWKTVYQNRSECYEEVPESWAVRQRQIMRWAKGHNQAMIRHLSFTMGSAQLRLFERLDGMALLGVYAMSPLIVAGWLLAVLLFYFTNSWLVPGAIVLFALISYTALGNTAAFFEIAAAARLDGSRERIRLLPLNLLGFVVSITAITRATVSQLLDAVLKREFKWDKTVRYRQSR
ncbi:MAG: glycosyltransferase family 2 protein [Betaproteobacteria bacterium]|nr:glycosyltransferase family 2 protein [Betaproteobacteria bacterium]